MTGFAHGGTNLVEMGSVSRHADEGMSWSSSACRVGNSFTPGTLVVMADGTIETIESIEVGDQVLATDTETGSTAAREVEAVITGTGDRTLVEVVTTDGGVVVATDGHPIWEVRSQAWVEAVDLEPGDLLLGVDGEVVEVADVIVTEE